jgi:hypothetical protein
VQTWSSSTKFPAVHPIMAVKKPVQVTVLIMELSRESRACVLFSQARDEAMLQLLTNRMKFFAPGDGTEGTCRSITFFGYDTRSSHARVVLHDALEQSIAIADRLDPGGERHGPNWPFAATPMFLPCPRGLTAQSSRLRGSRFEAGLSQATHSIVDVANRCSFLPCSPAYNRQRRLIPGRAVIIS